MPHIYSKEPFGVKVGSYARIPILAALTSDIILRHENSLVISNIKSLNNPLLELPVLLGVAFACYIAPPVIGVYAERGLRGLAEYSHPRLANIKERFFPTTSEVDSSNSSVSSIVSSSEITCSLQ